MAGHLAAMLLATLLFGVSLKTHREQESPRFKFVAVAFGLFAIKETLMFFNVSYLGITALTGVSHALNLLIIATFFRGTIR